VVQAATPLELLTQPVNAMVADFVGGTFGVETVKQSKPEPPQNLLHSGELVLSQLTITSATVCHPGSSIMSWAIFGKITAWVP
jgi:ABC-type proline/glycine betaine transport system ATPase subunit